MHITITSGSASGALGLAGTGFAIVFPDQKWIGGIMIALAIMIFWFDIRSIPPLRAAFSNRFISPSLM
jgi:hypothetical protein